ncbi:MAG: 4Fe-4S dicluster domain-containing protein [Ignavibacteriales bacterium]|nr:4Fe-4S dicluster domain-containing protein [Ignavibacteriales bacterium]
MSWFKLEKLKKIRVIVSLLFFIPISILFIDPRNGIPSWVSNFFVSLQVIPSLTKILVYSGTTAIGLIVVTVITIAFGRVYCSTLCPLGTFQDIIIHIKKKVDRKKRFEYIKSPFFFHYSLLAAITIFTVGGSLTLLNLFEPFSNYGRILTNTIEPITTLINNIIAGILGHYQNYFLYNVPLRYISMNILIGAFLFLGLLVYMSYYHGRLFCNSLCPAGALLGLISRFALFKIVINKIACNDCGACEKVCKANCIESETKRIDFAACVGCFNCIKSCPTDGIIYSAGRIKIPVKDSSDFNPARRKFFKEMVTPAIGLTVPALADIDSAAVKSGYDANKKRPISPPGSRSIQHFSNLCTACHLCVSACPTQVLYPSFLDYGLVGIFQPKMNYDASFCNYECTVCSQICPSGAILPIDVETKKLIQIGKSIFVKDDCVVVAKKKDCAACAEHCPTKAVYMVPYEGKLKIPEQNNDICIGCGACEHACPTTPRKAIYVAPNRVHLQAQKPKIQKQEKVFDSKQDFPF